jgi:hypothetical protein
MPLVTVADKGAPLSAEEHDGNLTFLHGLIQALQSNPPVGVGVTNITAEASQVTFHLSNGQTRGPFQMPSANFRFRDAWAAETVYLVGDFFSVEELGLVTVLLAHTSQETFDIDEDLGEGSVYALAVPYISTPAGWHDVAVVSNEASLDLAVHDKFLITVDDDCEVQVPVNGYDGQPFAVRIHMDGTHAVTFHADFVGEDPDILVTAGDHNVLSGIILETDPLTAVINAVKVIPAP